MNIEERIEREAELLAGKDIGRKVKMVKVLTYVNTMLGGTFIEEWVEEDENATS